MKKIFFTINCLVILLFFTSCIYHPHYICEYISDKKLYSKTLEENFFDPALDDYTVDENIFVLIPEATLCYTESKAVAKCRFLFSVFSKSDSYKYNIDSISLILDGKEHDIYEYPIDYYPYEKDFYTSFSTYSGSTDYYWSNYHLGYFTFPTPKDKEVEFKVTVSDFNLAKYTFTYKYSIKFTFDLFISKV